MSEISVQCKYMLRVNIRTLLKMIFGTKNIIGGLFRLSIQYVSQLLTVLNQKSNKTIILTCRCSMCIENESTGKYTCSHAPYTRFTSVYNVIMKNNDQVRDVRSLAWLKIKVLNGHVPGTWKWTIDWTLYDVCESPYWYVVPTRIGCTERLNYGRIATCLKVVVSTCPINFSFI